MRHWILIALLCGLTLRATAQNEQTVLGQAALSFDASSVVQQATIPALQRFDFYLVVNGAAEVWGYFGQLVLNADIAFASAEYGAEWMHNIGIGINDGRFDYFATGTGCLQPGDGWQAIAHFEAILLNASNDLFIGIDPYVSAGTSYDPGWISCAQQLYAFQVEGSAAQQLKINPTSVATDSRSWCELKSLYR